MSLYNKESGSLPKHVNFDSKTTEEDCNTIESLLPNAEVNLRLADIEKQPEHVAKVLRRFLRGDWELDE